MTMTMTQMTVEPAAFRARVHRDEWVLETRTECPTCGAHGRETIWRGKFSDPPTRAWLEQFRYAGDPFRELGDETFDLVRCTECAMLFHARVLPPAGLDRLYGEWIDGQQVERFESERQLDRERASRFELARQTVKHLFRVHALTGERDRRVRLLDYGCGDASAVALAASLDFDAWGVEPSLSRAPSARSTAPRVRRSIAELAQAAGTGFDAVLLFQVLEHLVEPRRVLSELRAMLRPGGVLVVEVPDARGIDGPPTNFDQFRTVQPLEHVNAFTPATLTRICVAAGFTALPRIPAHATASFADVIRTEASRWLRPSSTSQYFVRRS
jgi:2-polyprenyl-3-methyl-5-hydroxy-6-metoxy-1,4-benzoquinol methylase